jgi:hypothetical protein
MQVGQQRNDIFCRQLQSYNSKANWSCASMLRGVPHCGLRRHHPLAHAVKVSFPLVSAN